MAQDQNSKLAHFVAQKNGQPDQNGKEVKSHEDLFNLKFPSHGKTAAASNTPIVREASQRRTRSSTVKNEHVPDDTDFSAIDRSSTESGTKRAHSHGDQVQTNVQDQAAPTFESDQMVDRPESEARHEAEVQYDNSSDGMPNDPFKQYQQARQQNGNTQTNHERATMHPGRNPFAAQQIQGDSYPPTTSGNPSVTDQRDGLPPSSNQPPEIHYPAKANGALPTRAAGTRVRHVDPAQVTNQNKQNHNPQVEPAARTPALPYGAPALSNINAGFSFQPGPAMKQSGTLAPTPAPPPQHGMPPQVHQAVTNVNQRGSPPGTNLSARQDGRHRLAHTNVQPVAAESPEKQRYMKKPPQRGSFHAPAIHGAEQASFPQSRAALTQRHELTSRTQENDRSPLIDNRKLTNYHESSYNEGPAQEEHDERPADEADEEPDLYDYEVEEICQMDFTELKNESFDVDPQADEFQLPGNQQSGTFQDKLHAVLELPHEVQSGFFKSLPAVQWEAAGDWFLDQFGDVLKKFKAARQSKRKAALEFEDEIEKRHEAISKKRKVTEDALGEMRKTGAVVLRGTPKKLKKGK